MPSRTHLSTSPVVCATCAWPAGDLDSVSLPNGTWVHIVCAKALLNRALAEDAAPPAATRRLGGE